MSLTWPPVSRKTTGPLEEVRDHVDLRGLTAARPPNCRRRRFPFPPCAERKQLVEYRPYPVRLIFNSMVEKTINKNTTAVAHGGESTDVFS